MFAPEGLDPSERLLPEFFREGGYSTHMIGKWHLGFCSPEFLPRNRGFDTSFGIMTGQIDYFKHTVGTDRMTDYYRNDTPVFQTSYCGKDFTDEAIQYAKQSENQKPFFTYLAYTAPHKPVSASQKVSNNY